MTKTRPLSYTLHQTREDGMPRTVARVECSRCPATLDIKILSGDNHLTLVEKRARQAGWLFNKNILRKCVCRECYLGISANADPVSGGLAVVQLAPIARPDVIDLVMAADSTDKSVLGAAIIEAAKEKNMPVSIGKVFADAKTITDKPRGPTPDEKFIIRQFLDGNYDEKMKGYIEAGMTDQRAANDLKVPLSWVRDLRELAYGPIECDVELLETRQAVDRLMKEVLVLNDKLKKLEMTKRA